MQDNGLNLALQSAGKGLEQLPRQSKGWLVSNLLLCRQIYWVQCLVLCKRQGAALSIRQAPLPSATLTGKRDCFCTDSGPLPAPGASFHRQYHTACTGSGYPCSHKVTFKCGEMDSKVTLINELVYAICPISRLHTWILRVAPVIVWKICTNASQGWVLCTEIK